MPSRSNFSFAVDTSLAAVADDLRLVSRELDLSLEGPSVLLLRVGGCCSETGNEAGKLGGAPFVTGCLNIPKLIDFFCG